MYESEQRDKVPFEIVANFQGFTHPIPEIVKLHSYLKSHILGWHFCYELVPNFAFLFTFLSYTI